MKTYLINLERDKARLERASAQLTHQGVTFERFPAVNGRELGEDAVKGARKKFRWWCALGRPIRIGEIGCAYSHFAIYRQMIERGEQIACVLEDDIVLSDDFARRLGEAAGFVDCAKPQVVLFSNHTGRTDEADGISKIQGDRHAESYLLTMKAAEALLKANTPMEAPCDYWDRWVEKGCIELYHVSPPVCRPNEEEFASNTAPRGIFVVSELSRMQWIWHKLKRVAGRSIDSVIVACEGFAAKRRAKR